MPSQIVTLLQHLLALDDFRLSLPSYLKEFRLLFSKMPWEKGGVSRTIHETNQSQHSATDDVMDEWSWTTWQCLHSIAAIWRDSWVSVHLTRLWALPLALIGRFSSISTAGTGSRLISCVYHALGYYKTHVDPWWAWMDLSGLSKETEP